MLQRAKYESHKEKAKYGRVLSICLDAASCQNNGVSPHYGSDKPKKEIGRQRLEFKPMVLIMHYVGTWVLCAGAWLMHGCNLTIECIHVALVLFSTGSRPIPRKLVLQLDNASDNKARAVLAYCAFLVLRGYFHSVTICFLIVGHTHVDVDQKISVFSWALRRGTIKALSFLTYVIVLTQNAFKQPENQPKGVFMLEAVHDWAAWLEAHARARSHARRARPHETCAAQRCALWSDALPVCAQPCLAPGLARFGCASDTADAIRCFKLKRGPKWDDAEAPTTDRVRLYYKKYMTDNDTLPRPVQKGQTYDGGEAQDQGEYNRITRMWRVRLKKAGVVNELELQSHGIPILAREPATEAPRCGATPPTWSEQLRHLEVNINEHDETWFKNGQNSTDRSWWRSFFAEMRERREPASTPDLALRWPAKCPDAPLAEDEKNGEDDEDDEDDDAGADPIEHGAGHGTAAYGRTARLGVQDAIGVSNSAVVVAENGQFVLYMYEQASSDDGPVLYSCELGVVEKKEAASPKPYTVRWWCRSGRDVRSYAPFVPTGKFRKSTQRDAGVDESGRPIPNVIEMDGAHLIYALSFFRGGETHALKQLNADGSIPKGKKVAGGRALVEDLADHFEEWKKVHSGELLDEHGIADPIAI